MVYRYKSVLHGGGTLEAMLYKSMKFVFMGNLTFDIINCLPDVIGVTGVDGTPSDCLTESGQNEPCV